MSEAELIDRLRAGNEPAFAAVVRAQVEDPSAGSSPIIGLTKRSTSSSLSIAAGGSSRRWNAAGGRQDASA